MKYKFMMYNWDGGEYVTIPTNNVVDAIYYAWNFECEVYEKYTKKLIFAPFEDNEFNSDLLKEYGIRLIEDGKYRRLQDIKTGEIYKAPWQSE
jgi:hypothetical protein